MQEQSQLKKVLNAALFAVLCITMSQSIDVSAKETTTQQTTTVAVSTSTTKQTDKDKKAVSNKIKKKKNTTTTTSTTTSTTATSATTSTTATVVPNKEVDYIATTGPVEILSPLELISQYRATSTTTTTSTSTTETTTASTTETITETEPVVYEYSWWTDGETWKFEPSGWELSRRDWYALCNCVANEAGSTWFSEWDQGKVCEVIFNRMWYWGYPSVYDVIADPGQFTGSVNYVNLDGYSYKVTNLVEGGVAFYCSYPDLFNEGYMYFVGDNYTNYFSQTWPVYH